jgi:hypothetical protein
VTASPLDPLRSLFGERLDELAGALISGELPVTTAVVNRLIARKLATVNAPVIGAEVAPAAGDSFTVHVRPKGPLPLLKVDVRIEQQPDLPANPTLGLRWSLRGVGALAMFAAPLLSLFKAPPPGITLDRDRVLIDLHRLLQAQGYGELIPLLTGLRVLTRENGFVVQFQMRR